MNWIDNHANALSALGSISSALVAMVAAIIAAIALKYSRELLKENRVLRLSGSDPEVVSYLTVDERVSNLLNLVIENVGSGPAFDVSFDIKIDADNWRKKNIILAKNVGSIPFTAIPQGRKIETSFALGFDVLSEPVLQPFKIHVNFKNLRGEHASKTYTIDVEQFHRIGKLIPESDLKNIHSALKQISSKMKD